MKVPWNVDDVVLHLKDLRRLDLKPGETLVVKAPGLSPEEAHVVQEYLWHAFSDWLPAFSDWLPGSHVIVLGFEMEMEVVSGDATVKP